MIAGILTSAVIVAFLTGTVNIGLAWRKSRTDERDRVRTVFAEAFAAYAEYREYPYAIRRRNAESPGEERVRISEKVRETQQRLNYYLVWTRFESLSVGEAYGDLVSAARRTAGSAMREAWTARPISEDSEMNIPAATVDLADLAEYEAAFSVAAHAHLRKFNPWPVRLAEVLRRRRGLAAGAEADRGPADSECLGPR
ncbi:hypothetical protein LO763_09990 [Glycomyces sp. A-F 0318]|uniref:hypothetical protein n=1 Tax=Glycomyces amatae TaxID=2881355 RepID=UPI001E41EE0F|nr:hypothetical protein [Glycomyces amatae]MCD0443953.1 hypothetical protein [Glycomyces amatae]